VAQVEGLDPLLLAKRQGHEIAQLHQLGVGEVPVQLLPQRIVGRLGIEDDGLGVGQRRLLALGVLV
jgi:hypothetical protein